MTATEETRAAVEDAIRAHVATFPSGHGILTDWIVIAAQENVTDNGVYDSTIATITPSDIFPMHRLLGLLDHATTVLRAMIANHRPDA